MSLISSIPSIRKIPPLPSSSSSKKDKKPEDYLYNTLMRAVYGLPVDPALYTRYARFTPLAGPGSDNWPLMAAGTWLWSSPFTRIDDFDAIGWWTHFFLWQLGQTTTSDISAPGDLKFFEMSEPKSNNYGGMICGSVLSVRLWACRKLQSSNTDPRVSEVFRLSGLWLSKWALLHSLFALPGPLVSATVLTPGKSSTLPLPNRPINLPILTQDGSRSTPSHIIGDPRQLILAELLDYPNRSHPWPSRDPFEYWYLILCRMLKDSGDELDTAYDVWCHAALKSAENGNAVIRVTEDQKLLTGLRWKPYTLYLFSDGSKLGLIPSPINGNTAPIHASLIRPSSPGSGVVSVSCWPWSKPKGQPVGSGRADISLESRLLSVWSALGKCPDVQLPAGPVTILHFTETGLTVERM
jgi:hypothetical protein